MAPNGWSSVSLQFQGSHPGGSFHPWTICVTNAWHWSSSLHPCQLYPSPTPMGQAPYTTQKYLFHQYRSRTPILTLSLAVTPDQFQHDVGWCYVIMILRTNTPLASTVWIAVSAVTSSRLDLYGWTFRNGYPPWLWYSSIVCEISVSFPEMQQRYSQVMERSCLEHGMAERDPSAFVGGHYFNLPLHAVSVPVLHLSSAESLCTAWVSSLYEWSAWENSCSDYSITKVHLVLATVARVGCRQMGRTKRHLWFSSLFPGQESGA